MNYYESFKMHWVPIYKKQVEEAVKEKNNEVLSEIRKNIRNNIHLTDKQKNNIFILIGLRKERRSYFFGGTDEII